MNRDAPPPVLATASWYTHVPRGYMRIGISRGPIPKGIDLGTLRYAALIPNVSARDTPPDQFHRLYVHRLAALDPEFVFQDILRMAGQRVPVLCGYPGLSGLSGGRIGCHRHLAADWFERALDIRIPEIGASAAFDRFIWWRTNPIAPSIPGDRPRTFQHQPPASTPRTRAQARLGQYKFKF